MEGRGQGAGPSFGDEGHAGAGGKRAVLGAGRVRAMLGDETGMTPQSEPEETSGTV